MSQQIIAIGAAPNDHTGDTIREAFEKTNENITELYNALGPNAVIEEFNDWFVAASSNFTITSAGTGSFSAAGSADYSLNQQGIIGLNTGTTAVGHTSISQAGASTCLGIGEAIAEARLNLVAPLSDGADRYLVHVGFHDSLTAVATDGCYFRYSDDINGGKWQAVCVSNGVETVADTNVLAAVSTVKKFRVVINPLATSAAFYIDGVLVATIATNIPSSNGRQTSYLTQIRKTIGLNARSINVDTSYKKITLTSPR